MESMNIQKEQVSINVKNGDSLELLKTLEDDSIDLVLTDPPYYGVKSDDWDNQWATADDFLDWLECFIIEAKRVLKNNGSIYVFCGPRLAAETELRVKKHFNVLNHIVWSKPSGIHNRQRKEGLRAYFPATERIIFAEQYNAERLAKKDMNYSGKYNELRSDVFEPIISYFERARQLAEVTAKEINAATGTQMCSHWFSRSQWKLPTQKQYEQLQELFRHKALNRDFSELEKEHAELAKDFGLLNKDYKELEQEYQRRRRYFKVSKDVPFTDVWEFASVQYFQGKHPCQKPDALLQHIIQSSSREGDVILDPFMGSGSTVWNAANMNRHVIAMEADKDIFKRSCDLIAERLNTTSCKSAQAA